MSALNVALVWYMCVKFQLIPYVRDCSKRLMLCITFHSDIVAISETWRWCSSKIYNHNAIVSQTYAECCVDVLNNYNDATALINKVDWLQW